MPSAMEAHPQVAGSVILVKPVGFGFSLETAASNGFQRNLPGQDLRAQAMREFDGLVHALTERGIGVTVLDPVDPQAPDAVFPNNWFSTDAQGRIVLYPMEARSRRSERDPNLGGLLGARGFTVVETVALNHWEQQGKALEGTGSLVLDRTARVAYAARSSRTDEAVLQAWCELTGFSPCTFTATMDGRADGQPVYHTNVLMTVGERFAMACMASVPDLHERHLLGSEIAKARKELVQISLEQMHAFAGNALQLRSAQGSFIFLSEQAFRSLQPDQVRQLRKHGELVPVAVPTIETVGGGSIRCMLAENFLPLRPQSCPPH